ncbi:alkaline phosphatase family protein [Niabella sp. 22666]|uniref:alkaline phosphatase family protein n=1 Tax=Niabella sp. 22666 TaxID=3453954 RepID=UPI003F871980
MKHLLLSLFIIVAAFYHNALAQRVVILGLDGFSTEGYKSIKHPHIDELFKNGVLSLTTRPVMPSVTLPNWTSHFTGSGPEEHGVTANTWTLQSHTLKAIDTDPDGYYPSIYKLVKEQVRGVKTAFYYNWAELINSTNTRYLDDRSFQHQDGYDSNYTRAIHFIDQNKKSPLLVFLYSVHTDHAGHGYGWMSKEYISAVEKADSAIGHFVNELKLKNLYKDTYFLLITDHGGINKGHGGVSMQEMQIPWAITGPTIQKKGLVDFYNSNKNTSLALAQIFRLKKIPSSWTGITPEGIFK